MSTLLEMIQARRAAIEREFKAAEEAAWKLALGNMTDEQRARGLGVLLAKVNRRVAAVADTGGPVVALDEEDERRMAALTKLITRLKDKGLDGLVDAPPASAEASPVRPPDRPVAMPSRSPDRFEPPQELVSSEAPIEPTSEPESTAPEGRRILVGFGEPPGPAPRPSEPEPPPRPSKDPRRVELERLWRMGTKRPRVPSQIEMILDPEFGSGEERGWQEILSRMRPWESAIDFANRIAAGHAAGAATRAQFKKYEPGEVTKWLKPELRHKPRNVT